MGRERLDPLKTVHFVCRACGHRFSAEPGRVVDAPTLPHHPFEYFEACPDCGAEAGQVAWERNLMKAHAAATGPVTEEGKQRTRFNAIKHGLAARTAQYFPARPGSYSVCEGCEHLHSVSDAACKEWGACLKRAELMIRYQVAVESRDPAKLATIWGDNQAAVQAMIGDMIRIIAADGGPRVKEVVWYNDKDGGFHLASFVDELGTEHQIYELKAHPLLKPLMDFISKNNMTLADMGMTAKLQDEQEMMQGYLDQDGNSRESADEFRQRMLESQRRLEQLINNSYKDRATITVDAEVVDD